MANKNIFWGILVLTLVFGMTFVGCDNGTPKDELDGTTWSGNFEFSGFVLTFNSPNFTLTDGSNPETVINGTYSISGNNVTVTYNTVVDIFTLSGNTLSIMVDGITLPIFTKL